MVYAAPVKKKNSQYVSEAFNFIFKQFNKFPNSIITDEGKEFYNSTVQKIFESYGINHYHTKTKTKWKAAMAERVIRTIKTRLQKYFYQTKTKRWLTVLPNVIKNYNATPHRTIGMAPDQVTNKNSPDIYKKVFGDTNLKVIPRLAVGDRVRTLREKKEFEKGYTENWSDNIYIIKKVLQKAGVVWYKLEDFDKRTLPGIHYYWQLNLVSQYVGPSKGDSNEN